MGGGAEDIEPEACILVMPHMLLDRLRGALERIVPRRAHGVASPRTATTREYGTLRI